MPFPYLTGLATTVSTDEYGRVNIRHQVTHVVCRNLVFGKGRVEDTRVGDILHLKMELPALMQMALGVC